MSVTEPSDPTATSGGEVRVVPQDVLTATDFIGVRAALVTLLGNDGNRALVLTRIHYRADRRWREAHDDLDGRWWWRATYATIASETGLSEQQARRCVKWLVDEGYVITAEFRQAGITDRTLSLRLSESTDSMSDPTDQGLSESTDLPSMQTEKTLFDLPVEKQPSKAKRKIRLPDDWAPSETHIAKAQTLGVDLALEAEKFRLHAGSTGRVMENWDLAFHSWLLNARPSGAVTAKPGSVPYAAPQLPPAPRFPVVGSGQYDPNYLQPQTPAQIASHEAEAAVQRQRIVEEGRRRQQER